MSDSAQVLAWTAREGAMTDNAALIMAWLVERGVVEALPTDSGLGQLAHRPGPRALDVVIKPKGRSADFRKLQTNGVSLEHATRASLHTAGDEMPVFRCPTCHAEIDADHVFPLLDDLDSVESPPQLTCSGCAASWTVNELAVESGVFANVVLRFWNWWPLKHSFVAELTEKCGSTVTALYERI